MTDWNVLNALRVPWTAGLVLLAGGMVLMVFGSRWRTFCEVLLASFAGGVAALLVLPPTPANPIWVAVGVCLAAGLLTLWLPRIAIVVLAAFTVGLTLSVSAHVLAELPSIPLLVSSLSNRQVGTVVHVPDYVGAQWMLGLLLGGMLLGVIVAVASLEWARRVVTASAGSLAFLAGIALITREFFSAHLPPGYPMKYAQVIVLLWAELTLVAILMQRRVEKGAEKGGQAESAE